MTAQRTITILYFFFTEQGMNLVFAIVDERKLVELATSILDSIHNYPGLPVW
jgi:hypothetical protein